MFSENPFKKDEADQYINEATDSNVICGPSNNPSNQSGKQDAVKQNFPGNLSIKIKQGHSEDDQWNTIMVKVLKIGMDERT